MKMNWYFRMMLSYIPIFFVVISAIIIIFFQMLNHASERKFIETNRAILERMVYHTDANLMLIERNTIRQLLMDRRVQDFFTNRSKSPYEYFEIQKQLTELRSTFPFRNTIYIYHEADGQIISDLGAHTLETFGDREFLQSQYTLEQPGGWTNPRLFAYSADDNQQQRVVSLMKPFDDGSTKLGAIVVNVYVNYIEDYLNSFSESDYMTIKMANSAADEAQVQAQQQSASPVIRVHSEYTGWSFVSTAMYEESYHALSLFSSVWMVVVMVMIILALVGFTIVTHMHYKPIQSIMEKVSQFSARKSEELGFKRVGNEFAFIETALDHLIQKSLDYENLNKEDSLLRQQRMFHDLLAGHLQLTDEQFAERMQAFSLPHTYDRLGVLVVEIDHYPHFTSQYETKDQHLLKFILENAFHDLGQQNNRFVWHAWMEPQRIAFVVHLPYPASHGEKSLRALAEEFLQWIRKALALTVTIGIGADSTSIASIADSYRNALDNVELKTVFGTNTVIDNRQSAGKRKLDSYAYLQALEAVVHSFRIYESDWREKLTRIFSQLQEMRLTKSEFITFVDSFVMQMTKAVSTMSPAIQNIWEHECQPSWAAMRDQVETLSELEDQLMKLMQDLESAVNQDRQARRHHSLALQAKAYIDKHYANPDLSLAMVSDYLQLQPSYLSQLFKEELGEKFVDYVLQVRLERAKQLLLESEEPVQSIAEQIGYRNVISFYRVFKKVLGVPPGEYRKLNWPAHS